MGMEMEMDSDIPVLVPAVASDWQPRRRVPVTILTGFLGAGKSTLLSRILKERHGWKVAVIMNELGPSNGVDKALLWERNHEVGEEWLEVENGCLCCTAKNETFLMIESLLRRRPDIEHIVIEASGAADPAALVQKLWVDEALESRVFLDAVTGVVDCTFAKTILSSNSLHYAVEGARQVAISDCILLNKIDLVKEAELEEIEAIVKDINPIAKLIRTQFSNAPLDVILRLGQYDSSTLKSREMFSDLLDQTMRISLTPHSSAVIRSFTVYLKRSINLDRFESWLFPLLWERRIGDHTLLDDDLVLRVKGVILLSRGSQSAPYALQVVQDKYELEPLTDWKPANSAIIFIGRIHETTEMILKSSILSLCE